ncbi:MAG: hypothetical protein JSW10_04525 [Pseudomonadota bacterium]|nr:MAG: hypothetical protein JSW10_04525 [Pseudomonadota bacterium]
MNMTLIATVLMLSLVPFGLLLATRLTGSNFLALGLRGDAGEVMAWVPGALALALVFVSLAGNWPGMALWAVPFVLWGVAFYFGR